MLYANNNQPTIKHRPPKGVMAPSHLKLVNTNKKSEPEKMITPKIKKYAGAETIFSFKEKLATPIDKIPIAWYIW